MGTQSIEQSPLVIHTDRSHAWGGQEIRILTELREMRRHGFRVGLIVPRESELARRAEAEEIPVYGVAKFAKFNLKSWLELFILIKSLKPSVLNTHSSADSWMAGAVARLCRVPLIIRTRHVLAPVSSSLSYKLFPHLIVACSATISEQLVSQGIAREKTSVLPTGNDATRFRFSPKNRENIRRAYNIGEADILVGNVAFLRHQKGHSFIIKTAAAMPAHFRFMLVGGGDDLPQLQALAQELKVADRVIFTGHQEQPEHFFSAFDAFFFSSREGEGISQSLVQALLNGLPVLSCRIPSAMETLTLVEASRLVDYNDVVGACQGLHELAGLLLRDPEQMEHQHQIIADRYGLQNMVRNLLAMYGKLGVSIGRLDEEFCA